MFCFNIYPNLAHQRQKLSADVIWPHLLTSEVLQHVQRAIKNWNLRQQHDRIYFITCQFVVKWLHMHYRMISDKFWFDDGFLNIEKVGSVMFSLTCPCSFNPLGTPVTKSEKQSRQANKTQEKEQDLVVETWKRVGFTGTLRILAIRTWNAPRALLSNLFQWNRSGIILTLHMKCSTNDSWI